MSTRNFLVTLSLTAILFMAACGLHVTRTQRTETPTPAPTPTPTQSSVLTSDDVLAMVSKPAYMAGCRNLSKTVLTEQISYRGVVPGKSTHDDVVNLLGEPKVKTQVSDQWLYDGFSVLFFEGKPLVELIEIGNDPALAEMATSLPDMIEKYGCPEIIYAVDTAWDNKLGIYRMTIFAYPTIGVEFSVSNYRIRLNSNLYDIFIYVPESLTDYLSEREWILSRSDAIVLSWNEAVFP